MAQLYPEFELPRWVLSTTGKTTTSVAGNLAGSAAAPVSLDELANTYSVDPDTTRHNLQHLNTLSLGLGAYAGDEQLRETIASLYDEDKVTVTADDVVIANATTGANLMVFHSFLQRGDHVIALYPTYGQLVQYPAAVLGAEVSLWRLDPESGWALDVQELKGLIRSRDREGRGKTKMLVLNNPHNPTGTVISTALQTEIVQLCQEHDILIFCDEIFRPLFHNPTASSSSSSSYGGKVQYPATSLLEHSASRSYDKILVTGSLSKPWGLSGIRVGWVVTTNPELRGILISMRQWLLSSVSVIDEVIAREALSPRCRGPLLEKTLTSAKANLIILEELVNDFAARLRVTMPAGAGTCFMQILDEAGRGVDDVAFCHQLLEREGTLLAPGSLTFGGLGEGEGDFRGFVRVHVTAPEEMFRRGVEGLRRMLEGGGESGIKGGKSVL